MFNDIPIKIDLKSFVIQENKDFPFAKNFVLNNSVGIHPNTEYYVGLFSVIKNLDIPCDLEFLAIKIGEYCTLAHLLKVSRNQRELYYNFTKKIAGKI